jgi:hypothetical protein
MLLERLLRGLLASVSREMNYSRDERSSPIREILLIRRRYLDVP